MTTFPVYNNVVAGKIRIVPLCDLAVMAPYLEMVVNTMLEHPPVVVDATNISQYIESDDDIDPPPGDIPTIPPWGNMWLEFPVPRYSYRAGMLFMPGILQPGDPRYGFEGTLFAAAMFFQSDGVRYPDFAPVGASLGFNDDGVCVFEN